MESFVFINNKEPIHVNNKYYVPRLFMENEVTIRRRYINVVNRLAENFW